MKKSTRTLAALLLMGAATALAADGAGGAKQQSVSPAKPTDTTYTITFDAGDPIGGVAEGAVLSNQYAAATGATFSGNAFTGASGIPGGSGTWATNTTLHVSSTDVGGLGTPTLSSGRLLHAFNADWLNEDGDPSILVTFAQPMKSVSAVFAGNSTTTGLSSRLIALDAANNPIQTAIISGTDGQQTLTVSQPTATIAKVAIVPGSFNDWVGVDNIVLTTPVELMSFDAD